MKLVDRAIARHTGRFFEPNVDDHNTVWVRCPVHGPIGPASVGAELFCVGCKQWIDTLRLTPDGKEQIGSLARRQDDMKRRILRKSRKSKKRSCRL
jgi:hypothetical protein